MAYFQYLSKVLKRIPSTFKITSNFDQNIHILVKHVAIVEVFTRVFSHIVLIFYSLRYSKVTCWTLKDWDRVVTLVLLFLFNNFTMMVCLLVSSLTIPYLTPLANKSKTKSFNLKLFLHWQLGSLHLGTPLRQYHLSPS